MNKVFSLTLSGCIIEAVINEGICAQFREGVNDMLRTLISILIALVVILLIWWALTTFVC
jgi:spore maturation protein SpmA